MKSNSVHQTPMDLKKVQKVFDQLHSVCEKETIKAVRVVLNHFPKLNYFMQGMGSYFFVNSEDKIVYMTDHEGNLTDKRFKELQNFFDEWDYALKLSGNPMKISRDKVIRKW